jgi:hypothetical protein
LLCYSAPVKNLPVSYFDKKQLFLWHNPKQKSYSAMKTPETLRCIYNQIGQHWTALLLPEGSAYTDPAITLQTAVQQQVYFLFAKTAPADPRAFIENYRSYLFTFRQNVTANLTVAWLSN